MTGVRKEQKKMTLPSFVASFKDTIFQNQHEEGEEDMRVRRTRFLTIGGVVTGLFVLFIIVYFSLSSKPDPPLPAGMEDSVKSTATGTVRDSKAVDSDPLNANAPSTVIVAPGERKPMIIFSLAVVSILVIAFLVLLSKKLICGWGFCCVERTGDSLILEEPAIIEQVEDEACEPSAYGWVAKIVGGLLLCLVVGGLLILGVQRKVNKNNRDVSKGETKKNNTNDYNQHDVNNDLDKDIKNDKYENPSQLNLEPESKVDDSPPNVMAGDEVREQEKFEPSSLQPKVTPEEPKKASDGLRKQVIAAYDSIRSEICAYAKLDEGKKKLADITEAIANSPPAYPEEYSFITGRYQCVSRSFRHSHYYALVPTNRDRILVNRIMLMESCLAEGGRTLTELNRPFIIPDPDPKDDSGCTKLGRFHHRQIVDIDDLKETRYEDDLIVLENIYKDLNSLRTHLDTVSWDDSNLLSFDGADANIQK